MGLLTRAFVPRSVRRAVHPVRTARRAATPRTIKKMQRQLHPVSNAIYSAERSLNTKPRKRTASKTGGPVQEPQGYVPNLQRGRILAAAIVAAYVACGFIFGWAVVIVFTVAISIMIAKSIGK